MKYPWSCSFGGGLQRKWPVPGRFEHAGESHVNEYWKQVPRHHGLILKLVKNLEEFGCGFRI